MQYPFKFLLLLCCSFIFLSSNAQINYPYEVKKITLYPEGIAAQMAYMDVKSKEEPNKNILLLHGKNFNGYYWKDVITFFEKKGYRVIVPDQIGWGKSDYPNLHYSFHLLSSNTKQLLDSLGIKKVTVMGHSMGGMLATRFALMYPDIVEKLILENPIGLEDYKTFVPYQSFQVLYEKEKKATYESYLKYQKTYYPVWKPEYEQYVQAQAAELQSSNFDRVALVNVFTYQMIYEQPVCYEFSLLRLPVLLIIGQADRTIVGKNLLTSYQQNSHGNYPLLGRKTKSMIKDCVLKELKGVGHIPHIQSLNEFKKIVNSFLP